EQVVGPMFHLLKGLIGGCAVDATTVPLPAETIAICNNAEAVLLGAVGGPQWDSKRPEVRPEQGLLQLRQRLGVYVNLRPANVLETSRLWREVVTRISRSYPDIELQHLYVDSCAMRLIERPTSFDVVLTNNMFGDILSDEAAMLTGSIGLLPSASLGERAALYEPVHGSAPDMAAR